MEKLIYAVTVESSLVRGMKGRMTPELKTKLKDIGIDLDQKLKESYPVEVYLKALQSAVEHGFPGVPREEAYRQLGELTAKNYEQTMLGSLMIKAVRLLGPHKMISRAQTQFKTTSNHMDCRTKQVAPTKYELWLSDAGERALYFEGVLKQFMTFAGAKDVAVKVLERKGTEATFEIAWKE